VATILIISSIVKRLFWRASPLVGGGGRFYSGGGPLALHWRRRWNDRLGGGKTINLVKPTTLQFVKAVATIRSSITALPLVNTSSITARELIVSTGRFACNDKTISCDAIGYSSEVFNLKTSPKYYNFYGLPQHTFNNILR